MSSRREFLAALLAGTALMPSQKRQTTCSLTLTSNANGTVTFDAFAKPAPSTKILQWLINWNDGTSTGWLPGHPPPSVNHAYTSAGPFQVEFLVQDTKGSMARFLTSAFTVNPPIPNTDTTGGGGGSLGTPVLSTSLASTTITVSWSDVTGETSYELWRNVNSGGYGLYQTLAADVLSYMDIGLSDGIYAYKVRARNISVTGDFSNEDSETVTTTPAVGDWFVATTGSDSNPGTEAQPFLTLMKAHDMASAGDIIIVENGTYTLPTSTTYGGFKSFMTLTKSGTSGNPITVKARNRHGAILEGNSFDRQYGILVPSSSSASYWVFDGLRIRNVAQDGMLNNGTGTDFRVTRCWIHNVATGISSDEFIGRDGIFSRVNNTIVEYCLIHDIGRGGGIPTNQDHAIYCKDGDNWRIRNNIIYNIPKGWCIHLYDQPMSGGQVYNNTFAFACAGQGHIIIGADLTNWDIANNISQSPTAAFVHQFAGSHSSCTMRNNICSTGIWDPGTPSGFSDSGNISSTNPQLVDITAPTFDFHTQAGSPARGAGLTLGSISDDYDGTNRSAPYDMGAYES